MTEGVGLELGLYAVLGELVGAGLRMRGKEEGGGGGGQLES